jgi:GNAT superfamily N-acetyltransferase
MEMRVAGEEDIRHLAGLLVRFGDEGDTAAVEQSFAEDLLGWWRAHNDSHVPFLATLPSTDAVGMAWLAVTARVPRPGSMSRRSGDVQSVFVVPEHRSRGVGIALLRSVLQHAKALDLEHVTVHSHQGAASLYERAGFTSTPDLLIRTVP